METLRFLKFSLFTILTLMAYLTPTKVTAQENSFAPAPVAGARSQPTVFKVLLCFSLFIFYNYVCNSLFDDPDSLSIDSVQNLFSNDIRNNPSFYEESVPNEHPSDYNQIDSLTSSDLQEIESVGNIERDNAQQNNLHSENRREGTSSRLDLLAYEERVKLKEVDAVEKYGRRIETTEPDEVDKQMHVNETTVDHICSGRITLTDLQQQSGKKIDDAAESLGVSRSTFKRICRANGIARWSRKLVLQQPATNTLTRSIGLKVSYNGVNVKFPLSLLSGKNDLEVEIEKRFGIQIGSFWIKYKDEDKDWILITCDKDLHHGMHTCIERGITTMKMHAG